ncbi:histidine phosphatase family protein [Listeria costaricensis]|uniref:histidine phosphatase family protein n=1 Tax=Listeria costaricensis TaxID=2026604 RepID=UPI0013C4AE0E|nr:histidine phosphatase family protein [Listeria costaricensis]
MTDKVILYLTRHGETMFNRLERVQGWSDTPLTEEGIRVAEALGRGLRSTSFSAVYTSDLRRTVQTAALILGDRFNEELPIQPLSELREFCFGHYEGLTDQQLFSEIWAANDFHSMEEMGEAAGSEMMPLVTNTVEKLDQTGMSENWEKVSTRLEQGIKQIIEAEASEEESHVLVVTHGMAINIVLAMLAPEKVEPEMKNASITKIIYENGHFFVESVNDMQYVEAGNAIVE